MAHTLILGITESGKTSLAKQLASRYRQLGYAVLVLDPNCDPGWPTEYVFRDADAFLDVVKGSRSCAVFVDESGEMIGQHEREMFWLATRARHWGHFSHFLAQRAAQVAPTVRDQCSRLVCFSVSREDAAVLAREWGRDELASAYQLGQLQYLACSRFGPITQGTLVF